MVSTFSRFFAGKLLLSLQRVFAIFSGGSFCAILKKDIKISGISGPHPSFRHMFDRNVFGLILMGPAVAIKRFFRTGNQSEKKVTRQDYEKNDLFRINEERSCQDMGTILKTAKQKGGYIHEKG